MLKSFIVCAALLVPCRAQQPRQPNTALQREAMKKLDFLVGQWSGEARILGSVGEPIEMIQTEDAQYRLDGLLLIIEGVGRNKSDGKTALEALGIISYDDQDGAYRMRAFNDGRYMETEVKLAEAGKATTWGFVVGEIKTSSELRVNDKGDWTERHEITVGSHPARRFMELRVSPQN